MKAPKPKAVPTRHELGPRIGHGQDNAVFQLVAPHEKPHLRPPVGWVVKIDHENKAPHIQRMRDADPVEAALKGLQYKKNKYEMLKAFLGDSIPDSYFVLGSDRKNGRPAEYTFQREVPQFTLADLSEERRADPKLRNNVKVLLNKLGYMHEVMGFVNSQTSQHQNLDGKLDLGGVSDYAKEHHIGTRYPDRSRRATDDDVDHIMRTKSPNLLVDPETADLYCIDFDQGQWGPGMDYAKELVMTTIERDKASAVGRIAFRGGVIGQQSLDLGI